MPPCEKISIIIADDHEIVRSGFRSILQNHYQHEITFVAEVKNGIQLIDAVALHKPQVVITDIQMPEMDGIEACSIINRQFPSVAVIAFSMFTDISSITRMIRAGASGYVSKNCEKEELLKAIQAVSRQNIYYCSVISAKLYEELGGIDSMHKKPSSHDFGSHEKTIMQLICRELTTKEIADQMCLAIKTVEHYRKQIQEKIGAKNMVGIAMYALEYNIAKYS